MPDTTIDEVIARMDTIIDSCAQGEEFILLSGPVYTRMTNMEAELGLSVSEVVTQLAVTDDACAASFRKAALRRRRVGRPRPGVVNV